MNERERRQWVLTREQRVSWMKSLPADNRIVEGALWSRGAERELSVEEGFARDLGAKLGSTLRFDIQGVAMDFVVTSIRSVRWRSFAPNFFLVAAPGALDDAPHLRFGAVRIGAEREQLLQDRISAAHSRPSGSRGRASSCRSRSSTPPAVRWRVRSGPPLPMSSPCRSGRACSICPRFPSWATCTAIALATAALSVLAGLLASARALQASPLSVLRRQG